MSFLRKRKLLLATGLCAGAIGFAAYEANPNGTFGPRTVKTLQRLPLRYTSHLWGKVTQMDLPESVNKFIIDKYSKFYNCNLDEMAEPLEKYKTIGQFFARKLKPGVRPFVETGIASPVDGRIMSIQEIPRDNNFIEQVKGIEYPLAEFLGNSHTIPPPTGDDKKLYHCIIYLAPGDYHGIHSPVDWTVKTRTHFPGYLFPVAPLVVKRLENILGLNERVVLSGTWEHGFFSLSPVGATNVGAIAISLEHEKEFRSNLREHQPTLLTQITKTYPEGVSSKRSDEIAFFHMGSTVVLIFESPELEFDVDPGQRVKMGHSLAHFKK